MEQSNREPCSCITTQGGEEQPPDVFTRAFPATEQIMFQSRGRFSFSCDVAACTSSTQSQEQDTWFIPAEHSGLAINPGIPFIKWSCNQLCADYSPKLQAASPNEQGAELPAGSSANQGCKGVSPSPRAEFRPPWRAASGDRRRADQINR